MRTQNLITERIARRVADRRRDLGLRQEEVAQFCGVSVAMISKYETGKSEVSAARLWWLAQALDSRVEDFFAP